MKITPQSSDAEINAAVAIHVLGFKAGTVQNSTPWQFTDPPEDRIVPCAISPGGLLERIPDFCWSLDLVMPLLHRRPEYCELQKGRTKWWLCVIGSASEPRFSGFSQNSAARAVCYALLKAAAVEVEP